MLIATNTISIATNNFVSAIKKEVRIVASSSSMNERDKMKRILELNRMIKEYRKQEIEDLINNRNSKNK